MTKRFCDRCGAEIPDANIYVFSNREYYKRLLWFNGQDAGYLDTEHEICEECQKSLIAWWNRGKE